MRATSTQLLCPKLNSRGVRRKASTQPCTLRCGRRRRESGLVPLLAILSFSVHGSELRYTSANAPDPLGGRILLTYRQPTRLPYTCCFYEFRDHGAWLEPSSEYTVQVLLRLETLSSCQCLATQSQTCDVLHSTAHASLRHQPRASCRSTDLLGRRLSVKGMTSRRPRV